MKKMLAFLLLLSSNLVFSQQPFIQWGTSFSPSNAQDYFHNAVVDINGNMYAAGLVKLPGQYRHNAIVLKINPQGFVVWSDTYGNTCDCWDGGGKVVVDNQGNAISFSNLKFGYIQVVKHSPQGVRIWEYISSRTVDFAYDIICDNSGNVYIGGATVDSLTNAPFALLLKVNSNGTLGFRNLVGWNTDIGMPDNITSLKLDNAGNINVGGFSTTSTLPLHFSVAAGKFSQSGATIWKTHLTSDSIYLGDYAPALVDVDNNNNVFVLGYAARYESFMDRPNVLLVKYDATNGTVNWKRRHESSAWHQYILGIAADNSNNVIIKRSAESPANSYTDVVIKFDGLGNVLWSKYLGGPTGGVYIDNSNSIYTFSGGWGLVKLNPSNGDTVYRKIITPTWPFSQGYVIKKTNNELYTAGLKGYNASADFFFSKLSENNSGVLHYHRRNLNKAINDLQTTTDDIQVSTDFMSNYRVTDLNITLDSVTHSKTSDLEVTLIYDNNVIDTLIYQVGSGQNFIGTQLNDSALNPIGSGTNPFTGSFKPSKPLSVFNSGDVNGQWKLSIYDRAAGNTGVLKQWSLQILVNSVVGIEPIGSIIPEKISLAQNYPNPFNPVTKIRFDIAEESFVSLIVYDMLGRMVDELVNQS